MALSPSTSSLRCKFCHAPPLCVINCNEKVYYDVHRLQSISRTTIHLGVHKHSIMDGKCKESMDKTKRLITRLMQKYRQFPKMLTIPSWLSIYKM
jgi:hypothetical protein